MDFFRRQIVIAAAGGAVLAALPRRARAGSAVLRIGDQRGSVQALLTAAGVLDNLPYRIEWPEFVAAAPLLEALNAGALDLGFVGDAPFAFAAAAGTPMKAVAAFEGTAPAAGDEDGGLAILVKKDSSIADVADL
jgi:sulfonate transport system substrate-binding protein